MKEKTSNHTSVDIIHKKIYLVRLIFFYYIYEIKNKYKFSNKRNLRMESGNVPKSQQYKKEDVV